MWKIRILLVTAVLLTGCKPAPNPPVESPANNEPATPAPAGQSETPENSAMTAAEDGVKLSVLNWEETQALVKQHPGKVVVVDLWATYCPPCIKEFPNLVRLNREHGDRVACISVSADYDGLDDEPVDNYREKVLKFLTKQDATFQNVLLNITAEKLFAEKVEQQSIPIVFVYDQKGELRGQFPDPKNPTEFTYQEQILPLVQKLLANE